MSSTTNANTNEPAPTTQAPIGGRTVATPNAIEEFLAASHKELGAVTEELKEFAKDVAFWLSKEFHLITKTPEERIAAQNVQAAASNPTTAAPPAEASTAAGTAANS